MNMPALVRLLIYGILFYLAYKLFSAIFLPRERRTNVKGKPDSKPLDLSKKDVEDVKFKEDEDEDS
jgi:hypothetical protein